MANSKANKASLQWPPIIDLRSNYGSVDTTFKSYKEINAPDLNDMLSPLYRKVGAELAVFDKTGNKYTIEDGSLCKNGTALWSVNNKHFKREEVTEQYKDYLAFDIGAYLTFDDLENTLTLRYNGRRFISSRLFNEGSIVSSRVRVLNNTAIAVVYYSDGVSEFIKYLRLTSNGDSYQTTLSATWYRQSCRYSASAAYTPDILSITNADPIIFISYNEFAGYCVSLISDYGIVVNPVQSGFITFCERNGAIFSYNGTNLIPSSTATSESVTTTDNAYFYVSTTNTKTSENGVCLRDPDGITYYELNDDNTKGAEISFPVDYTPASTGVSIEIDGVTYIKCNWYRIRIEESLRVACPSNPVAADWSFVITWKDNTTSTQQVTDPYTGETYSRTRYHYGSSSAVVGASAVSVHWDSEIASIPTSYWGRSGYLMSHTSTSTESVSWLVAPNIFFDNGKMYSFWRFTVSTGSWTSMAAGNRIIESATITSVNISGSVMTYSFSTDESITITSDYCVPRSIGYNINQGLFEATVKLNNTATQTPNTHASSPTLSSSYHWLEYMNSNASPLRFFPGTTRYTAFNYYANVANLKDNTDGTAAGGREDYAVYTVSGFRDQLGNTNWNILVNTSLGGTSLVQGLSYSESPSSMGTLLTPWASIDDDVYIVYDDDNLIYRDAADKWWKITIEDGPIMVALLDDRYILVNTTSYWNMYDSVLNKKFHYATDYNARGIFGVDAAYYMVGDQYYSRLAAQAINAAYVIQPRLAVTSLLLPYVGRIRINTNFTAVNSVSPEDNDTQGIDIYYGGVAGDSSETWPSCKYRFTYYPFQTSTTKRIFALDNTSYSISSASSSLASPNIFTEYVQNPGNRDTVNETYAQYTLIYIINNSTPIFAYSNTSEALNVAANFVLQGQYYSVINDKIYSVIYNNGVISEQDAIIDIRGMQFVGANPMIAFFWSESQRAFYSFTGDANLKHIYDASEISHLLNKHHSYFYDESSQTIFCPTNVGLLCFGPKNHYLIRDYNNVSYVQISDDGITHITNDGITDDISYYSRDEFEAIPLELETDWWGQGDENIGIIDRWQIVLYDITGTSPKSYIKVGTRVLNDISATSEIKEFTINPNDWDKWSRSILINYNPKLIKGKAVKLIVETPMIVTEITAHAATNNAVNISKHSI